MVEMVLLKILKEFVSSHKIFKSLKDQFSHSIGNLESLLSLAKTFMLLHCLDENQKI